MTDLQKLVADEIVVTLVDPEGAGSDLYHCDREASHGWLRVEGNLDVEHLASHIIVTLGLKYEYATRLVPDPKRPELMFQSSWKSYARAVDDLVDDGKTFLIRRLAPGKEEVIEYTGPRSSRA